MKGIAHVRAFTTMDYEATAAVETDDAGRFHMTLWPTSIGLTADAEGYTQEYAWGTAPGTFALVLTPASEIAGTVVDGHTHTPIAGAIVELYPSDGSREATGTSDQTDDEGRFHFDRLVAGRYAATASAPHAYGRSDGSLRVGVGQVVDGMVVTLEPAANVEGKLLVEGMPATPCEKPSLSLWQDGGLDWVGQQDGAGHVRVEGVLPGKYRVEIGRASCRERV